MALPPSGPISISQARDEYGLSNPVSMSNFHGKPGFPGSGPISFYDFYGKSNYLDQKTVTVGFSFYFDGMTYYEYWGWAKDQYGSINSTSINMYPGKSISSIYHGSNNAIAITLEGGTVSNSGWNTMNIGTLQLTRSAATFYTSSSYTQWYWTGQTNPFGTTQGAQVQVVFN